MRGAFLLLCVVVFISACTFTGGNIVLPDVANLSVKSVTSFVPGDSAMVTMASYSLRPGSYEVKYNLTGANISTGNTAAFLLSDSIGTFFTHALVNPGDTKITITMITNSSGGYATLSKNNTKTFTDSIGLMTAAINDTGSYKAMHITATRTGTLLTIQGTYWTKLTTITLNIANYTSAPGVVYFNAGDATNVNGNVIYSKTGTTDSSQHGVINITSVSPLLAGTFSFTNKDSSKITNGTFSCAAP